MEYFAAAFSSGPGDKKMKTIPFFDLKKQNKRLESKFNAAFHRVVRHSGFILGEEVAKFEQHFAQFAGTRFAVGVNSGLDALSLALRALGIGPGDEVIVPANSFIATALAVTSIGADPVFSDVDSDCLLMELGSVERVLTGKTKAIIPVHLYGQPVPMELLVSFCKKHSLYLVEDACQAHGASILGKRCGGFGDLGCFSFYPGKNLGAFGDGGMITTDSEVYYQKLLLLRNYGSVVKYNHPVIGFNTRLDALQAALLDVKLQYLAGWNAKREALTKRYDLRLKGFSAIRLLKRRKDYKSAHHLYVIRLDDRARFMDFMAQNGIGTAIHYPLPIHQQGAYAELGKKTGSLPIAENESKRVVSLPLYPELSLKDVDTVCSIIEKFLTK